MARRILKDAGGVAGVVAIFRAEIVVDLGRVLGDQPAQRGECFARLVLAFDGQFAALGQRLILVFAALGGGLFLVDLRTLAGFAAQRLGAGLGFVERGVEARLGFFLATERSFGGGRTCGGPRGISGTALVSLILSSVAMGVSLLLQFVFDRPNAAPSSYVATQLAWVRSTA